MIISRAVADNLAKASWIRRMFEEGARLKQERGSDKVFDFTLGNPEIEPPPAVLAAARRVLESPEPHLHAYMPKLQTSGGLCYFLHDYLGHPVPSPALLKPRHDRFVAAVTEATVTIHPVETRPCTSCPT